MTLHDGRRRGCHTTHEKDCPRDGAPQSLKRRRQTPAVLLDEPHKKVDPRGEKKFPRPTVIFHLPLLPVKISENWHASARARAACSIAGKALRATPRALPLTKNTQLHTSDRLQPPQMPPKSPARELADALSIAVSADNARSPSLALGSCICLQANAAAVSDSPQPFWSPLFVTRHFRV